MTRIARLLLLALFCGSLAACGGMQPVTRTTAVNEMTFPQALPPDPAMEVSETPPPPVPLLNNTYRTVEGRALYRIGHDDVLEIMVSRGTQQDRFAVPVQEDGTVFVLLTDVQVDSLTSPEAKQAVVHALSRYFNTPRVEVRVKEFNSKKVTVMGSLGGDQLRGSGAAVSLKGKMTVSEAIGVAGGFNAKSNMSKIRVNRPDGTTYLINIYKQIQEGDMSQAFVLDDGDTILVSEHVKGMEDRIYLLGEVKTPGPVPLFRGLTVMQAVAGVGGWSDNARFDQAAVIRAQPDKTEILLVDLRRLMIDGDKKIDQYLRANDVVFIPRIAIADWNSVINQLMPTFALINQPIQTLLTIRALGTLR
jgi:polysaccharide export outer membrane protein